MAAKTKWSIFIFRSLLAACYGNVFDAAGHVTRSLIFDQSRAAIHTIRCRSHDIYHMSFFSKSGGKRPKIDEIGCGFLENVQRCFPLRISSDTMCADFFFANFFWQIPLENDILLIFYVSC